MKNRQFRFSLDDLPVTVDSIEEVMGYNEGEDRQYVRDMIGQVLADCRIIADVRSEYRVFENISYEIPEKRVSINGINFDVGKIVFTQLKKSSSAALFLSTAGHNIGRKSRIFMQERDLFTGYIYDVAGSEIAEAATDLMQSELEASAASEGLKITNRYSPGYCGWDVAGQHQFFELFGCNFCGIKLNPSALMDPEKSVSGIIGLGPDVRFNPYTCSMCDMDDCLYRRLRQKKKGNQ